jgi:hypothetical protein
VVSRNGPTDEPLNVQIFNSDPSEVDTPVTVTIPAGQSSVAFTVDPLNDGIVDGTQAPTIQAFVKGFGTAVLEVCVEDAQSALPAADDAVTGDADEPVLADVLSNDGPGNGDPLTITSVDGQAIAEGETITTSAGTNVTLTGGELVLDGEQAYAARDIGETADEVISYTITDGVNVGTADLTVTFCGDANSVGSLDASLAGISVSFVVSEGTGSDLQFAYTLELTSDGGADRIPLGIYGEAYCVDGNAPLTLDTLSTGTISLLSEANLAATAPGVVASRADEVNWLLNQDFTSVDNGDGTGDTYTDLEVQEAIWLLLNEDTFFINELVAPELQDDQNGVRDGVEVATLENAAEIALLAGQFGDGFEAQDGDKVAVLIDPVTPEDQQQPFVVVVNYDDIDGLC